MTRAQRRVHLRLWLALAVLLPLAMVGALLARRPAPDQAAATEPPRETPP